MHIDLDYSLGCNLRDLASYYVNVLVDAGLVVLVDLWYREQSYKPYNRIKN